MKDLSFATELFSAAMKDLRAHSPTQPPYSGSTVRLQGLKRASLSISFFTAVIPRSRSAMPDFGSAFMR